MFKNKTILITGGTGSFGNAALRRFLSTDVGEIRIFSRDEKKQEDMRLQLNNDKVKFYLGDVRDYDSVLQVTRGVDYIFHAAALKQVPSCEFYPMEAVRTNILGAGNVLNASLSNNVKKVIVLSTDKAVYPINAMGLSKAMMEKLMIAKSRMQSEKETVLSATRYGNVMASRGSVIPRFVSQIKANQPITITEPTMTRFLMSLEDSVDLILYTFQCSQQGDIFVQKAPASTIDTLAKALIELFNSNSDVRYIGARHGEKLYESLVSREEMAKAEDHENYYRISADNRDLNSAKYFVEGTPGLIDHEDYTSHNTHQLDVAGVKKLLLKLDFIQEQLNFYPRAA